MVRDSEIRSPSRVQVSPQDSVPPRFASPDVHVKDTDHAVDASFILS